MPGMSARHRFPARHLLGCCVAALACSGVQAAQDCTLHGASVNPSSSRGLQGRTGILRCTENGELVLEQEVLNGKPLGPVRTFQDGQLLREASVNTRGNLQGRVRDFAPDGQVLREAVYDNGAIVGLARRFHPNGKLQRASAYGPDGAELASVELTPRGQLSALRCGDKPMLTAILDDARACGFSGGPSQVDFFSETGTLRTRARFMAGKRVGLDTFDNGKITQQEETTATSRIERTFAADGVRRRELHWTLSGNTAVRDRELEFSPKGALVRERRWKASELASEMVYYLNGQLRRKAEYTDLGVVPRVLMVSEYYDTGVLASDGAFANTSRYALTPVGTHRQFDLRGKLKSESVYDDKGRSIRERSFNDAGQPVDDESPEEGARKLYSK